jgi:peptidyl-prolyl cis-trans isomerase B (cyclophilin B)
MRRVAAFLAAAVAAVGTLTAAEQQPPPGPASLSELRKAVQPIGAEPIEVLDAERAWAGADMLLAIAAAEDRPAAVRAAAVRAVGRLEDPRVIPQVLALKDLSGVARGDAIAQSLKGFDPSLDRALVATATEELFRAGAISISDDQTLAAVSNASGSLSRIQHIDAEHVHLVEDMLLRVANYTSSDPRMAGAYTAAARNFESLFRVNTKVAALEETATLRLRRMVRGTSSNDTDVVRLYTFMALLAGRALDDETERLGLKANGWELRRVAMSVLAGGGAGIEEGERLDLIQEGLADRDFQVRYEALRAYVRRGASVRGCAPIDGMLRDESQHVVLAAIDALGELCKDDEDLTVKIAAEARLPPTIGSWHRETHAFVALAKRSPEKAAPAMEAFTAHPVWWVRMYAAGAAAVAGDLVHLEKLVFDSNDNVREAALDPWRRLKKADADPGIMDALKHNDVQLLRTAANLLKDSPKSDAIYRALLDALRRLTTEGKETSRDARLPLLESIAVHASPDNANELAPLLRDFDPKVAEKAAQVMTALSGRPALANPQPYRRGWPQEFKDLRQCVSVQLSSGASFRIEMQPSLAPIAVDRFLKLALKDHYYDGLSIHRVVPNFVLQGGSPNANEYSGAREFMRDEIAGRNTRGTLGLSTRGRNTGDAQFFINLVDNPRLNEDYTVFARLATGPDYVVVDKIQEGEVMRSINPTSCPR